MDCIELSQELIKLCNTGEERDEEIAIDRIFDFFVDALAYSQFDEMKDFLLLIEEYNITDSCILAIIHFCKDNIVLKDEFEEFKQRVGLETLRKLGEI